jgi:hypothetical protein
VLHNEKLQAIVKLDGHAATCELDAYEVGQNFGDTLRRHSEHYHRRALEQQSETKTADGGITSAHDRFHMKHVITAADVAPDVRGRGMFHDRWNDKPVTVYVADVATAQTFIAKVEGAAIRKRIGVKGASVVADYVIEAASAGTLETTLDIAMPCCDGYAGRVIHGGQILGGFGQPLRIDKARDVILDDRYMNGSVSLSASREGMIDAAPYFTVSQSEDGLEKVMQSVTLTMSWRLDAGRHEIGLVLEASGGAPLGADSP